VSDRVRLVRHQWAEAYGRLTTGGAIAPRVLEQMAAVTDALRRRIGRSFTLAELVSTYDASDVWALEAIEDRSTGSSWVRTASAATDAAFHLYARGARDYEP
jgi:hypothetical protein